MNRPSIFFSVSSRAAAAVFATLLAVLVASAPASAELKVAVLNAQDAILATEQAQGQIERFNQETAADVEEIRALQADLGKLEERMLKDGEVMSDAEKRRVMKDREDLRIDLQFKSEKLRKDQQDRLQEIAGEIAPSLQAVVQDLTELEGYDLILPSQGIYWANPKHDITRRVTEKLNQK